MQKTVIKINNLTVYYGNICALSNINLEILDKDFLAIIGPNGGGKSTLLKAIMGFIKPDIGNIYIKEKIGYVPQFSKFDKSFPICVHDVILMGRLNGNSAFFRFSEEDKKITSDLMQKLDIFELKDRQIGQLSGGQLQRVLIARALAINPSILLLDEPTASLDSTSQTNIYKLLCELNKDMTIITISHDIGFISSYVKSIACLNKELYYHGKTEIDSNIVTKLYGCPVDLIAHGMPHRVLKKHQEDMNV